MQKVKNRSSSKQLICTRRSVVEHFFRGMLVLTYWDFPFLLKCVEHCCRALGDGANCADFK